ncbi:MAG: signal peptidase I [Myxococcales bacterium]|nr:signal peptidase I [Myxococcota bacterium]MDW8284116.1 signal peptidase I [Myxococcales bacterium]
MSPLSGRRRSRLPFRLLVEHFWLVATPLFVLAFLLVVHLANPLSDQLALLPAPRLLQALAAALLAGLVMLGPYLLFRQEFDRAREEVSLLRDARLGLKDARRRLRRHGHRLAPGARQEVEAATAQLEAALRQGQDLEGPLRELEGRLEEHLSFARKGAAREYAESIGVAVFIALVLRAFVVEAFKIPSGSMIPTLQVGDHIFVNKFIYGVRIPWTNVKIGDTFRTPRRGEVIVFVYPREPDKDFIKRIIAVAGDVVDMRGDQIFVNGQPLPRKPLPGPCEYEDYDEALGEWRRGQCEAYLEENGGIRYVTITDASSLGRGTGIIHFPYTVPPRSVFVMGDNRDNSHDSRFWGPVPYDLIKGKAWIIWWSAGKGASVRLSRMFDVIHP